MSLHSEMTSVTFKAKTKKCKPSLGPGIKTVWRRLQSSNKNADPNTVSGQSRHQTTHQSLTCSMTAQQHKNNSDTTVLSLSKQMSVLTKHQPEHNDRQKRDIRKPISHLPAQRCHNNVRKTFQRSFPWRYRADSEQENSCCATNNLLFCKLFGLCAIITN